MVALVLDSVEYDFLLSRPDVKLLRLNIYWDDTVSVDQEADQMQSEQKEGHQRKLKKDSVIP